MNFFLNDDQQAIRDAIRELCDKEIAPKAAELDRTHEFPWANFRLLAQQGYLCMQIPEEYGGAGLDYLSYAIVTEELARACASTSVIYEVHNSLHSEAIFQFGTEEQRQKYLPRLAAGEILGAYALTEPGAGSDAGSIKTRAVLEGGHYVLNGQKTFITSGGQADSYIVMASTDPAKGSRGISAFIIENGNPGMSFGKPEEKMGIRASHTTDIFFNDCRVTKENLLGKEGEGFKIALASLDGGRIGIAAQAVGITQAALDIATQYAKTRVQFGQPIASFQAIQWKLADMATDLEAARLLLYRAAFLRSQGVRATKETSMAKMFASDMAMKHTVEAVQVLGGYGYMTEYKVERLVRDAKITQIYEGTNEIQRMVIARHLLS